MSFEPQIFGEDGFNADARSAVLSLRGPHISVMISSPKAVSVGINTDFLQLDALIDTGATDICIDMYTAERLHLMPIDTASIGGIGGRVEAKIFAGRLEVPNLKFNEVVRFFSPVNAALPSKVILGRSFLRNYIMTYDGPSGIFQFYHPTFNVNNPVEDE